MKKISAPAETFARIRVIGVGGSGGNAINHMIRSKLKGIEFIAANTDSQDLKQNLAQTKILLGSKSARGLGTGMNYVLGKKSALESKNEIIEALKGTDLLFVACGMGGGTGTGAAPIITKIARDLNILTIAVITLPFSFEGKRRLETANIGIEEMKRCVDSLLILPNDKILSISNSDTKASAAFAQSDEILLQSMRGISDLITIPGNINIDFADIKTILENSGTLLMGVGCSKGENRTENAVKKAINSPLLNTSIKGANRVLFSIASKGDINMNEIQQVAEKITESVDENAKIIFGTLIQDTLPNNTICVTVLATSFESNDDVLNSIQDNNQNQFMEVNTQENTNTDLYVDDDEKKEEKEKEDDDNDDSWSFSGFLK